jgi:hypothetical protein
MCHWFISEKPIYYILYFTQMRPKPQQIAEGCSESNYTEFKQAMANNSKFSDSGVGEKALYLHSGNGTVWDGSLQWAEGTQNWKTLPFRENLADSEDTDPRRSYLGVSLH